MALYWFQCKKCVTLIKKDSSPSSSGCPKGSLHDWHKLAEVGDTNFQCKKMWNSNPSKGSAQFFELSLRPYSRLEKTLI